MNISFRIFALGLCEQTLTLFDKSGPVTGYKWKSRGRAERVIARGLTPNRQKMSHLPNKIGEVSGHWHSWELQMGIYSTEDLDREAGCFLWRERK